MYPVHDTDALLMLATALAAKRRPAELIEIIAAAELIQSTIPAEQKLSESFARLSAHGLIQMVDGGFTLTEDGQAVMAAESKRKADAAERIFRIKDSLAAYATRSGEASIVLGVDQLAAVVLAHRQALLGAPRSLLVPKPKPEETNSKRPGQRQRKPLPPRRRKP